MSARIVYWGAEASGKSANLQHVHQKLRSDHRGELRSVATALDPSVSYEMLPITLGELGGMRVHLHVVAVPGGAEHAPTRKQLLDRVDGVVLVVDASPDRIDANLEAFDELRRSLAAYGRGIDDVALVVQYNKRDLADDFTLEELHRKLDLRGAAVFEAVAAEGKGVLQALTTISKRVIRRLREEESRRAAEPAPAEPAAAAEVVTALEVEAADPETALLVEETVQAAELLLDAPQEVADPLPAPATLEIVDLGSARRTDPRAFAVPVTLRDEEGRTYEMTVSVRLDPPEPAED